MTATLDAELDPPPARTRLGTVATRIAAALCLGLVLLTIYDALDRSTDVLGGIAHAFEGGGDRPATMAQVDDGEDSPVAP